MLAHDRKRFDISSLFILERYLADPLGIASRSIVAVPAIFSLAGGDTGSAIVTFADVDQQAPTLQIGSGLLG